MRFSPGIYTIVNRSPIGTDYKTYRKYYYLDNQTFWLVGDSMVTVRVFNNLIIPDSLYNKEYYFAYKVSQIDSTVGNVAIMSS